MSISGALYAGACANVMNALTATSRINSLPMRSANIATTLASCDDEKCGAKSATNCAAHVMHFSRTS
jgi:hypothetical protein